MNATTLPTIGKVRRIESRLRDFAFGFIIRGMRSPQIKSTGHYKEWRELPLNYARIMELPLALLLLEAVRGEKILDVSSPKLLALYLASKCGCSLAAGDLESYFVKDFEIYRDAGNLDLETAVFDAAERIPYADDSFDKAFSVSVLEHIPGDGDKRALREMHRVVAPGGIMVITLPAFTQYAEEWITDDMYWQSVKDANGRTFFQRRYDEVTLQNLIAIKGLEAETILLVAEKPIKRPEIGPNGVMRHNSYLLEHLAKSKRMLWLANRFGRIPFLRYFAEKSASKECHYLTTDWKDENIRQVVVKLRKTQ